MVDHQSNEAEAETHSQKCHSQFQQTVQDCLVFLNKLNHYGNGTPCQSQANEVQYRNEDAEVLVISFSNADSEPGAVVIVSFYAVVAVAAVDGSEGTIDMALDAVLGADR